MSRFFSTAKPARSRRVLITVFSTVAVLAATISPASAKPSRNLVVSPGKASVAELTRKAREADEHPTIKWTRCAPGLQCGTIVVPLDYTDMTQGTMEVSVGRRVADNPAARLGSVFVNPGGPGGSAMDTLPMFAEYLGPKIRNRFDLVAVEPRGVDFLEPADCTSTVPEPSAVFEAAFPYTTAMQKGFFDHAAWLRAACGNKTKPRIIDHMSTGSSARDLDQVRKALGESTLNYYGVSYGSYLGATYANLFPDRVRAVAVDGVIDPVAWATGYGSDGTSVPVTERINSGRGAQEALQAAIDECERVGLALCPSATRVRFEYTALMNQMRSRPIKIADAVDGEWELSYDQFTMVNLQALYDHDAAPLILDSIDQIYRVIYPSPGRSPKSVGASGHKAHLAFQQVKARGEAVRKRGIGMWQPRFAPDEETSYQATFEGVLCSDSVNPQNNAAWSTNATMVERQAPGFGLYWLWGSASCPNWPGKDRAVYRGPFNKTLANGLLIVSSTHDPATPLSGAQALRGLSPNSRLVTVKGMWGHSAFTGSTCAADIRTEYLLTGTLPADDVTCEPDHPLFTRLN